MKEGGDVRAKLGFNSSVAWKVLSWRDPSYHRSAPDDRINDSIYTVSRDSIVPDLFFFL